MLVDEGQACPYSPLCFNTQVSEITVACLLMKTSCHINCFAKIQHNYDTVNWRLINNHELRL